MTETLSEQLKAVDWTVDLPADAPSAVVADLRKRRTRRRGAGFGGASLVTAGIVAAVTWLTPFTSSPQAVNDGSQAGLPPASVVRFLRHDEHATVTLPSRTAAITEAQAIAIACSRRVGEECGSVRQAWLVDLTEQGASIGSTSLDHLTVWLVRTPEPLGNGSPARPPANPLRWTYAFVNATTGRIVFSIFAYISNGGGSVVH